MTSIFSIDGNIGSGKSTLLNELKSYIETYDGETIIYDNGISQYSYCINKNDFVYLPEPVEIWETLKDKDGNTILSKFYGNMKRYSFSFQMMAYISRLSALKETIRKNPNKIIITERSVETDKNVFAKMLYDSENIEEIEYQIYLKWFDEFIKSVPVTGYIYVRTSPEKSQERILKRNRDGEVVSLDYLKNCHNYHEQWMENNKVVLFIEGNYEKDNIEYERSKSNILSWIIMNMSFKK